MARHRSDYPLSALPCALTGAFAQPCVGHSPTYRYFMILGLN
ncbi:hypothetical protein trd_A0186 (plasmid) [Thermomicrobium roseum DSM 5159]|uniref:Uncharacterized protein n=1 Tax=Thermomicrobium roseum (strain ATCC 27502 / DSM 5159 / P-2) TaxID=309801 RepID=B9L322_THERP|nr:hypothetical protein trd_A0186 [Thermomicrobium roseum DSM 5159]